MPTTNPVPSNDPTDLLFNAQKLDQVVNGSAQYYTDRLGVNRRTMEGISAAADVVLGGLGYAPPVAYAAGISLTLTTQTVEYSGEVYAPKVASLPFTTSTWATDSAKFRLIQGVAATDLAASGGAGMIGYMPEGTDAAPTTVQEKLRETVSVKDFGAVGDGIHDDTEAIQHAVDYAASLVRLNSSGNTSISAKAVIFDAGNTYRITGSIYVNQSAVALIGEGGSAHIRTEFSGGGPFAGGKKAAFVIGSAEAWASSFGTATKHNVVKNLFIDGKIGTEGGYGIILSGVRNPIIENVHAELLEIGFYFENCSEGTFTNLRTVGCNVGKVLDGRYNRTSILGFSYGGNDVSNNDFITSNDNYPQHAGIIIAGARQNRFLGTYVGQWGDNPVALPLDLPSTSAGIHLYGQGQVDFNFISFDGVIFEANQNRSSDCFRITLPSKSVVLNGLSIKNAYVQTYAVAFGAGKLTHFACWDLQNTNCQYGGVSLENCGYYYNTLATGDNMYDYPPIFRSVGVIPPYGVQFKNIVPYVCLNASDIGQFSRINELSLVEQVDMNSASFLSEWALGAYGSASKVAGSGAAGVPAAYRFTGNVNNVTVSKSFNMLPYAGRVGYFYVSFDYTGTGTPAIFFEVNGQPDTGSWVTGNLNSSRYSTAMLQSPKSSGSAIYLWKPFAAGYEFDSVRVHIGRYTNSDSLKYIDISNVRVGFVEAFQYKYNPVG